MKVTVALIRILPKPVQREDAHRRLISNATPALLKKSDRKMGLDIECAAKFATNTVT